MTCPDWPTLRTRRDSDPAAEAEWEHALVHLDGCKDCRDAALQAEPTLLFRRLPGLEAGPGEIAGMKQAVSALRRNHELERPAAESRRRWRYLRLVAANAAVLVGAALLAGHLYETPESDAALADVPAVKAAAQSAMQEQAVQPSRGLRFDIQVLRADPSEVVVLAQASVTSLEGEDVRYALGENYQVSFKPGRLLDGERLRLEDFRVTRQIRTADKSRQLSPRDLFFPATVNLRMTKPLTLVPLQDETSQQTLVVAITCHLEDTEDTTERVARDDDR